MLLTTEFLTTSSVLLLLWRRINIISFQIYCDRLKAKIQNWNFLLNLLILFATVGEVGGIEHFIAILKNIFMMITLKGKKNPVMVKGLLCSRNDNST